MALWPPGTRSSSSWSRPRAPPCSTCTGSAGGGEQFDEVAGRVGEQDLASARAGYDVAAEGQSGAAQALDLGIEIVNGEVDAVAASSCGVRRCGAGAGAGRSGQQQPQRATGDVGEGGEVRGAHGEAEVSRVEIDSSLHVVDDVADAGHTVVDLSHGGVIPSS